MRRLFLVFWFGATLAIGGWAWWYLFAPGAVPAGQPELAFETEFRRAFAAGVGKNRIVAVFSPTTVADLETAQQLQALLMEYENDTLETHVVWYPKLATDWAPTTDAMGRVWDGRARHYWDNSKSVLGEAGASGVFVYARGAGLDKPVVRVADWKADLPKIREFLGTPKKLE